MQPTCIHCLTTHTSVWFTGFRAQPLGHCYPDSLSPTAVIGGACSQSPECGEAALGCFPVVAGLPFPYIYCSTCTTGIECSDFTTSSKMCQVFSEKMGLEAGWNCHICLRTEHSTDASATMPPAADMSHGYASMMMDSLLNINSTQPHNGRRTRVAVLTLDRIRYNTIRDAILMCAQTLT